MKILVSRGVLALRFEAHTSFDPCFEWARLSAKMIADRFRLYPGYDRR